MLNKRKTLKHKFGAKRTLYNEKKYSSKLEARYAQKLDILKKSGELLFYLEQVPFRLPGNTTYRLDFAEFWKDYVIFTECKGYDTPIGKLKIAQVQEIYGIEINIIRKA